MPSIPIAVFGMVVSVVSGFIFRLAFAPVVFQLTQKLMAIRTCAAISFPVSNRQKVERIRILGTRRPSCIDAVVMRVLILRHHVMHYVKPA
ncbi:hypothetical protein BJX66DRAFT_314026 [Aspergillus keveii]|uniref:Secreted protein n=1 Tax=Aspergillus keveii TaxID=714993 RepID=A0ABR4FRN8_9EURO